MPKIMSCYLRNSKQSSLYSSQRPIQMVNPAGIKFKVNCVKSVQKKKINKNRHQTADMSLTSVWCLYFFFCLDFTHFPGVSIDDLEKANSGWE